MGQSQVLPEFDYAEIPHVTSAKGKRLHINSWIPEGNVRAIWYICHGVSEYVECYTKTVKVLNEAGIAVFGHDQVGHGYSEGDRVYVESYSEYVADLVQRLRMVREEHPDLPLALYGHSMGGLIAVLTAAQHADLVDYLVLSAPAMVADPDVATPMKVMLGRAASYIVPQFEVGGLPITFLTHDAEALEVVLADPLRWHGGMKAGWGIATLQAQQEAAPLYSSLHLPMLVVHGTDDRFVTIQGSRDLVAAVSSKDKTLKEFEGGYHKLDFEPDGVGDEVRRVCVSWLLERLEQREATT